MLIKEESYIDPQNSLTNVQYILRIAQALLDIRETATDLVFRDAEFKQYDKTGIFIKPYNKIVT